MSEPARPPDRRVLVLGAGPAGLAAAHVLASRGVAVDVLERGDQVGGLARTHEHKGFRFDLGGHRWFTKNDELHRWFLELMAGELVEVRRVSRIYFRGTYFDYPIRIGNVLAGWGLGASALAALSYLQAAASDALFHREPVNMKEAFTAQFGARLYEMFFRRYSEKVWGRRAEEISADWVDQRSRGLSVLMALKDALGRRRDVVSLVERFVYPRLGYQRICERMAEDVARRGGRVHLRFPVRSVTAAGDHDFRVEAGSGNERASWSATDVISTIPLTHLVSMLAPAPPPEVRDAALGLRFRDLITVTVMVNKPQITTDTWLYIHDDEVLFARLHEPKNWSAAMVPTPGVTHLVCECFCTAGDPVWALADEAIATRVVDDLVGKLRFLHRDQVIDTCVVRTRFAYPVYSLDYRGRIDQIFAALGAYPGLHAVGRGGAFRYNNADHSIEMGQLVAKRLLGETADPMSVNTERAYHEEIRRTLGGARKDG